MSFFKTYSLGTMMMAWRLDKAQAREILAMAIDNNITLIDTSVSYARGACHSMLAEIISDLNCAHKVQIATKVGGISSDADPDHFRGLSKLNIHRQCNKSLQQLGVDALDLLQLHFHDSNTALEEQVESMQKLQAIGKIKAWGVCNYTAQQMVALHHCAKKMGGALPISNQIKFNLIETKAAQGLTNALKECQMQSIIWGPLSSGLLTNKTARFLAIDPKSRIGSGREKDEKNTLLKSKFTKETIQQLVNVSNKTGVGIAQIAIAWVTHQPWVNSVLLGPSSLEQFKDLITVQHLNSNSAFLEELSFNVIDN